MLPHRLKIGLALGLLLLCSSSTFVTAGDNLVTGPINCYTCIGIDECAQNQTPIRKCEDNDAQTCLTVFDAETGAVAQRGCSDTIKSSMYATYCADNPDKCPSCPSNGCNDAVSLSQFVQCVSCDSATNSDCVLNPAAISSRNLCQGECMTALYSIGPAANENYQLVRSCLRDRDLDERTNCLLGKDAKCIACNGANCNMMQLPEKRQSCFHCASSEECEGAKSKPCLIYNEQDQCYVQFDDENNDVIGMGCRSEFDNNTAVIELVKKKSFYLCNGENCNDFEKFPQPNDCTQCNSKAAVECAIKPTAANKRIKCLNVPYTQCFQRVEDDGSTTRGCLADLEGQDFYDCLTNADANCKICTGIGCNEQIIPEDRVKCHRCNSLTDSSCHSRPSEITACPTYNKNDACVSVYENGVTKRGCLSELACDANSKLCQQCRGDGCNTENVKKRAEEIYGIFQELPINCNTCQGDECLTGTLGPRKCENDPLQDCMTIFNSQGVVVRRGCENAVLEEYGLECEKHPELCFNCKSNGCNKITVPTAYEECLYCDSAVNPDCLTSPSVVKLKRKCAEGCLTALYARKDNTKVQDLVRTCFEDIEMDNRETCTTENNCVKCSGTDCNTKVLPEGVQRLSCNYCEGANCDEPVPQLCPGYIASDQCYIHFENVTHSAIRMGCRSDLSNAEVLADIKEYFICDGDNCNTYENLPPARLCYVCSSKTDINCAIDTSKVKTISRCPHFPYTECYTRILEDGSTERGCQYNLPTEKFIECNTGKDLNCRVCSTSNCNDAAYPSDRQRCLRCNSLESTGCEAATNSGQVCPIYDPNETCTTKIENSITYRGCGKELNCNGLDRKSCKTCTDYNCNTVNLIAESVGEPGQFQNLPLNCYHCNDTESCAASLGNPNKCNEDDKQTCTVAFSRIGEVLERGCSNLLDDVCSDENNSCFDCKSNGCNVASVQSDYVDCIYCDASQGDSCSFAVNEISRTRKCYKSCMTTLYPRTKDANPVYELLRTCLDDLDLDDREDCADGKNANCKACSGNACNTDLIGARKSCYQCKGDECQDAVSKTCRAYQEGDQCFVEYDETGSIVELGCKSNYDAPELNTLLRAKRLWMCDEDNCNTLDNLPTAQHCTLCNSLTDPKCAIAPESVTSSTACSKMPYTQCYTRILQNGLTERGCVFSLEDEQFVNCLTDSNNKTCVTCVGENCNDQIHPADRLTCNTCNSETSTTCEAKPKDTNICLKYSIDDKCVSKLNTNGVTIRGCSTDVSCENSVNCQTCEGANCNKVNVKRTSDGKPGIWQPLPLTCHVCDNEQDCAAMTRSELCSGAEYCMTVFNENSVIVQRGCSAAVERDQADYCDGNTNNCHNCNSNNCNSATSQSDYIDCIYCDTLTQPDCSYNVAAVSNKRQCHKTCMTILHPRSENSPIYDTTRSCLDDMEPDAQIACTNESNSNCKACNEANCNTAMLPEDPLSCWKCEGETCEDPATAECQTYTPNDQCYLMFNNDSNVERMGCLSDLPKDFVDQNRDMFILCDEGNNCNGFEKIPNPSNCVVCDSLKDIACATSPNTLLDVARCTALPNTQCYVRNNQGYTQRGCVSDLAKSQLISCLYSNSTDCFACVGDRCNNELFPSNRRRCHRCNSVDDPSCANVANSAAICPFYTENEFCCTKLVNGETYRGCSSDFTCDESDRNQCRLCYNSDNCNVVNLVDSNIGDPGKWQGLPLNCYNCSGVDCANSNGKFGKCEGNNMQTCMTVFDGTDGSVMARGCSDAVIEAHGEYCDRNSANCFACKSNGCNTAATREQYIDCYDCDSNEHPACAINLDSSTHTRKCNKGCMVALYPRSSSNDTGYELTRTCWDDKDLDDREACKDGTDPYCKYCEGAICNSMDLPEDRHECYHCVGDDCEDVVSLKCSVYYPHDQCFTLFNDENSIVLMGCRSDLASDSVTEMIKQKKLLVCDDKNCNTLNSVPTPRSCSVCNSANNTLCATNPNLVAHSELCLNLPYTDCVTRIDSEGHTDRNCLSSLDANVFYDCLKGNDDLCEVCSGDNCNEIDLYPPSRLACHQCNSKVDSSCSSSPKNSKICPVYSKNETCIVTLRNGVTERGCSTTLSCDNPDDLKTCRICDSYGCNIADLEQKSDGQPGKWQDLPLNCRTCNGTAECAKGSVVKKCENNNLQNCVTVFDASGAVIQRSCSDSIEDSNLLYCESNEGKCPRCNSNGCNMANSLNEYISCLACDTDTDGKCVTSVESITKTRMCYKQCMTALYERESESNPAYNLARTCLDDLDLDDLNECVAGTKNQCHACDSANCNNDAFPEKRLSCYVCSGDACQDPQQQTCVAYRKDDQCYIRYDETRSIVATGCRSEFSNSDADFLFQEQRMLYCEGDNCNSFDALPGVQTCAICNSRTDINCAINPAALSSATTCNKMPNTGCYSRVLPTGETERACVSSLNGVEFASCRNGTSDTCQHCTGTNCNKEIYPANRLSCHICDSTSDTNCQSKPNSLGICPKYAEQDTCATTYVNEVTTRGCSSSLLCDASNPSACDQCTGNGCNTINLAKKQDDNFGKWQDLPLQCWSCSGDACKDAATTISGKCQNNNEQDCMTVFDASGDVMSRGCSDAVLLEHEDYCDENEENCYSCKSNDCNTASSQSVFVYCVFCDSHKNQDCVWSPNSAGHKTRKCQGGCMTALYPADSSNSSSYELIRTCLNDKEATDQNSCLNGQDETCLACTSASCNVDNLPEERLTCHICQGDNCEEPTSLQCPLYKKDDQCYVWFDSTNSVTQMGCISSFHNQDLENILKTKRIYVCEGKDCNSMDKLPVAQQCIECNSKDNALCATNAYNVGTYKTCNKLPYTLCVTELRDDGSTSRGCVNDLESDDFAACLLGKTEKCAVCQGEACNRELFPADRQQCYTCSSEDDKNCESFPETIMPCRTVSESETCVTALSLNTTIRGCSSDVYCDFYDKDTCRTCSGTKCNSIDLRNKVDDGYHGVWQVLPLECHTCAGIECNSSLGPVVTCTDNNAQDCMTVFGLDGEVARRGCSDDVEDYADLWCRENPDHCFRCKSNECNNAYSLGLFVDCVFCDSLKDPNCVWSPLSDGHKTRKCQGGCMTALYPANGSNSSSYILTRSCLNDKEVVDQNSCVNGKDENCLTCNSANCNIDNLPEERLSCHTCQGDTCEEPTSLQCPLYKEDDQCYAWFDSANSVTQMGCISSFHDQDLESILKTKRVYVCKGKDCNSMDKFPVAQKCTVCDSKDNELCATNAYEVSTFKTCSEMPNTQCVNELKKDGTTTRGCLNDLDPDDFVACLLGKTENCAVCQGEACNREIFPADRLQCHICSTEDDEHCESFPETTMPCPIVSDSETCVTALSRNTTVRGCSSDVYCDFYDRNTCRHCSGTQCNSIDLRNKVDDGYHGVWQVLPLKCHTCVGSECNSSLGPAVTCTVNNAQDCMTVFGLDDEVERRGCSDDVEDYADLYCRENPSHCFRCKSNECNIAWELSDYVDCAYCNSTTDLMCAINPENSGFASRSCYKHCMVAMKDDEAIRSCLDDKELYVQHLCTTNEGGTSCAACEGAHCNKFVYPADRLECHVCSASDCSNSQAQYCNPYDTTDFCFARYENGVPDLLGCASSQNDSDIADWEAQNRLLRCTGNDCNALDKLPLPIECVVCDSSKTPNCAQAPSQVTVTEKCQGVRTDCLTKLNSAGDTLRNCVNSISQDEATACVNAKTCEVCSGDKCNVQVFPANRRKCYICNSTADRECTKTGVSSMICPKYDVGEKCVASNINGIIQRGCSSDITCSTDDTKNCQICDTDSCNTADYSAAGFLTGSLSLTLLLAFVAILSVNNN